MLDPTLPQSASDGMDNISGGLDIQRHIGSSLYTSKLALCQEILYFAYQLHAMPVRICHGTSFLFTPLVDKQSQRAGKVLQGVSQACGFAVVFPGCYCQSQRMKKALRDPICQASVMLRRAECKYWLTHAFNGHGMQSCCCASVL